MKNKKVKKYFMGMYAVKKYMRLTIHKLILYFLGLLKKKIRSHFGYVGSPGFQVDSVGYLGLTMLIASMSFDHLKPSQGPESSRSRVNLPGRAEFYIYAPNQ